MSANADMLVVTLDYDGVLVDTEPELTQLAWRTAGQLWPEVVDACAAVERVMDEAAYVNRRRLGGQPLRGQTDGGIPVWLATKMRLLRPVLTGEHDALLLLRLCADEALSDDRRKRPLTVGEISSNWDADLRETLYARYRLSEREAVAAIAACRAAWRTDDADGWQAAHGAAYGEVLSQLRTALSSAAVASPTVYVLAPTQDEESVRAYLASHSVHLAEGAVLTIGSGAAIEPNTSDEASDEASGEASGEAMGKTDALAMLRARHPGAAVRYVDDDVESLRRVAADPRLFSLGLYHASWGYAEASGAFKVAAMPRVRPLSLDGGLDDGLEGAVLARPPEAGGIQAD